MGGREIQDFFYQIPEKHETGDWGRARFWIKYRENTKCVLGKNKILNQIHKSTKWVGEKNYGLALEMQESYIYIST